MKKLASTTALAGLLALGMSGFAHAQAVNPAQPGSASGGMRAQAMPQGGGSAQPGTMQPGMTQSPATGGQAGTSSSRGGMSASDAASGTTGSQSGTAGGGSAGQAGAMSEQAIRSALQARGYSDIEGMRRDGDHFRVNKAERFGEDVSDLRIDARTGMVRDEARLSEDQAKNLLESRGYSDISEVSRDGDAISAKARQGDRQVNLRIDARSGTVTQQQASN